MLSSKLIGTEKIIILRQIGWYTPAFMHSLDTLKGLRLLKTFVGVLQKKKVLNETPINYISVERL